MAAGLRAAAKALAGQALLVVVSVCGGLVANLAGLPAPWMAGGLIAVAVAGNIWTLPRMLPGLRDFALLTVGIAMGAAVTPETLRLMATFPVSFALLVVSVVSTVAVSALVLVRWGRWRRDDAVLGSAPGALSTVLALAVERKGDVLGIGLVQNVRLLIVVVALPIAMGGFGPRAAAAAGAAAPAVGAGALLLMALAGIAVGALFERIGVAAGMIVGGAVASGTLHGGGWVVGGLPPGLSLVGFVLVGIFCGVRMGGLSLALLRQHAVTGLASFVVALAVALLFAALVSHLVGVRFGAALLAFAPGGVEAMSLLSVALDLEPLYVGAHHLVRVLGIALTLPLVMAAVGGPRGPA